MNWKFWSLFYVLLVLGLGVVFSIYKDSATEPRVGPDFIMYDANILFSSNSIHANKSRSANLARLLCVLIQKEADPTDDIDMLLVGSTVLNRVQRSSNFPSTIDSVILQENQYTRFDLNYNHKIDPRVWNIVQSLYKGIGRNYEVLYFYNPKHATDSKFINWVNKREMVYSTKHHKYFK